MGTSRVPFLKYVVSDWCIDSHVHRYSYLHFRHYRQHFQYLYWDRDNSTVSTTIVSLFSPLKDTCGDPSSWTTTSHPCCRGLGLGYGSRYFCISRVNRLRLAWVSSFSFLWALRRYLTSLMLPVICGRVSVMFWVVLALPTSCGTIFRCLFRRQTPSLHLRVEFFFFF